MTAAPMIKEQELPVVRKLLELAERVEAATGPDRELDMLIDCVLKGIEVVYPTEGHPMTPGRNGRIEAKGTLELLGWIDPGEVNGNFSPYGGEDRYPPVTASLDAAMTLVPEGWGWRVGGGLFHLDGTSTACLARPVDTEFGRAVGVRTRVFKVATPALALTAACLKARASTGGGPHKDEAGR